MSMVSVPRYPIDLAEGDVITVHPDHHEQEGEWILTRRAAYLDGDISKVAIDYRRPDGWEGRFVVPSLVQVFARVVSA